MLGYPIDNRTQTVNIDIPDSDAVVEGTTNLYYTDTRVQAYLATILGLANGIATLDGSGQVPASQLPSYVDDVLEFPNLAGFPATGESGKIYIAQDTGNTYRWTGSTYLEISVAPDTTDDLPEGTTNLYYTTARVKADETNTSLSRVGNAVHYINEDGTLSTADMTQQAGDVVVSPGNGLAATNVQAALDEHQTDINALTAGAITDHGALSGLGDDDHPQYHNDTRGDLRYYTQTQLDGGQLDNRYYQESEVDNLIADFETSTELDARDVANRDRANHTGTQNASTISDFDTSVDARITLQKGVANGLATLDAGGLVPAAQLPSFVDDVLEFANLAAFPATGETGKIYVALDTNITYRWSGSAYVVISASPGTTDDVPEGSVNLYFTDARADARITALAYTQAQLNAGQLNNLYYTEAEVNTLIADFETTTQLNTRDTNNRNRANHTGTQTASTISDFEASVRSTPSTGLVTTTNSPVIAADTNIVALGKLQAQIDNISTELEYYNIAEATSGNIVTQAVNSPYVMPVPVINNNGTSIAYNTATGVFTLSEGTYLLEGVMRMGNLTGGGFCGNRFKQVTGLTVIGSQSVHYAPSATSDFTGQDMSQGVITVASGTLDVAYYLDFTTVAVGTLQWNPQRSFLRITKIG